MEKELNISEILKDKPVGTKLYSPCCGVCTKGNDGSSNRPITLYLPNRVLYHLLGNGKEFETGEIMVYPSKEMRDWSKFAWKKGDVLTDEERFVIFECFDNDEYTEFSAHFEYNDSTFRRDLCLIVNEFRKVSDDVAQEVIKNIEGHYGGKLNLETLEIEKPQFKDGDIVVLDESEDSIYVKCILILKAEDKGEGVYSFYAFLNTFRGNVEFNDEANHDGKLRLATEEEKKQLFDALAKGNKAWDAEKKAIVDLPKKCEFKPFDKVVVRHGNEYYWGIDIFSNYGDEYHDKYQCLTDAYEQCLPYNDQTAHLLGTTDNWKGGEE